MSFYQWRTLPLEHIASWLVWLADKLSKFNDYELRRAHNEVQSIADDKYDWRIEKFNRGQGVSI